MFSNWKRASTVTESPLCHRGVVVVSVLVVLIVAIAAVSAAGFAGTAVASSDEIIVNETGGGDYETIQDAVDNATEGDTIRIQSGEYREAVTVTVDRIKLRADEGATPEMNGTGFDEPGITVTASHEVVVDGLEIRHYGEEGILVQNSPNVTVTDVNVSHNGWESNSLPGVMIESSTNVTVANITGVDNGLQAVHLKEGSHGALLENNTAMNNDRSGIYVRESNDTVARDNTGVENGLRAIHYEGTPNNIITGAEVYNNTGIDNDQSGLLMAYTQGAVISDNNVSGFDSGASDYYGIQVDAVGANNTIRNNTFVDGGVGIFVGSNSDAVTIDNNTVQNVDTLMDVRSGNATITANDASSASFGVEIGEDDSNPQNVTLAENDIDDVTNYGVNVRHTTASLLANNTITNTGTGIDVWGFNNSEAVHNSLSENDEGVLQRASVNTTVHHNEITHSNDEGYRLNRDNTGSVVANNTISHGEDVGIWADDESNSVIRENTIIHNSGAGIDLSTHGSVFFAENTLIEENNISHNGYGIQDAITNGGKIVNNYIADNRQEGIELSSLAENTTVEDNTIVNNHHEVGGGFISFSAGVSLGEVANLTLTANTVENNSERGVVVEDGATDIYLEGNVMSTQPADIGLEASGVELVDNTFESGLEILPSGVSLDGFVVRGEDNVFEDGSPLYIETGEDVDDPPTDATQVVLTDVKDVDLEGGTHGTADTHFGVFVGASENVTLANATVEDATESAIRVAQGANVTIAGFDATGDEQAVLLEHVDNLTLASGSVIDSSNVGVSATETPGLNVTGLTVSNPGSTGIDVDDADGVLIHDTLVEGLEPDTIQEHGIEITDSEWVEIRDSVVRDNDADGVRLGASFRETDHATVMNNTFENNTRGLRTSGENATVVGNDVIGNEIGIDEGGNENHSVSDNTFTDNEVGLELFGENITANGNVFESDGTALVLDGVDDSTVDSNEIANHTDNGIELVSVATSQIRNNTVAGLDGTSEIGIRTDSSFQGGTDLVENTLTHNADGIYVEVPFAGFVNLTVESNEMRNNYNGITVDDEVELLRITENRIESNDNLGIRYSTFSPEHYLNGTFNYWGAHTGPSGGVTDPETGTVASGAGDEVDSNVRFDPWLALTAVFTFEPKAPDTGENVTFNASESTNPAGDIDAYLWDFTDDGEFDEITTDPVTNYTFDDEGEYDVTLVVNDSGEIDGTTETVVVGGDEAELTIGDFENEFPDGDSGDDYGKIEIPVEETAGIETEDLNVTLQVVGDTEGVVFSESNETETLQNEQRTFEFDVGTLNESDEYTATVTVDAENADVTTASETFFISEAGESLWEFETDNDVYSSPTIVEDTVYVGSDDNNLYAVHADNGSEKWSFEAGSSVSSSPTVGDDVVYVGSRDTSLYAIHADNGSEKWSFETGNLVWSSPTVVDDVVYVGSADDHVYAIHANNGSKKWSYETSDNVWSSPTVVDDVVYIGSDEAPPFASGDTVHALHAENGSKMWGYETDGDVYSSPTVADGTVYVGSSDSYVYAFDAETGTKEWEFETDDGVWSSPTVEDDLVYVGSYDSNLYALYADNGTEAWEFETQQGIESSPTVADGVVYFGGQETSDGRLYGLDAHTGEQIWHFDLGGPIESSPTVYEGVVYVGNSEWDDYRLFAIEAATDGSSTDSRVLQETLGHHDGDGELGDAFFDIEFVDLPSEVDDGSSLSVDYEVENTGDATGTQDVSLFVESEEVNVTQLTLTESESEARTVIHDTTGDGVGDLNLTVETDDDTASATVEVVHSVVTYADEDGVVETDGLLDAISDWRGDDIDTDLLLDVINAWRSGEDVT